jgi:hypothetical protein
LRCTKPIVTEIGLFEAIHSARALRRLKPDPVPGARPIAACAVGRQSTTLGLRRRARRGAAARFGRDPASNDPGATLAA